MVAIGNAAFGARGDVFLDFLPLLLRTASCCQGSEPLYKFPDAERVGPTSAEKFVLAFQQHLLLQEKNMFSRGFFSMLSLLLGEAGSFGTMDACFVCSSLCPVLATWPTEWNLHHFVYTPHLWMPRCLWVTLMRSITKTNRWIGLPKLKVDLDWQQEGELFPVWWAHDASGHEGKDATYW